MVRIWLDVSMFSWLATGVGLPHCVEVSGGRTGSSALSPRGPDVFPGRGALWGASGRSSSFVSGRSMCGGGSMVAGGLLVGVLEDMESRSSSPQRDAVNRRRVYRRRHRQRVVGEGERRRGRESGNPKVKIAK